MSRTVSWHTTTNRLINENVTHTASDEKFLVKKPSVQQMEKWFNLSEDYSMYVMGSKYCLRETRQPLSLRTDNWPKYIQDLLIFKGIVIAGGYVCNHLLGRDDPDSDIDVFFYGSVDECNATFEKIKSIWPILWPSKDMSWSQNENVVNAFVKTEDGTKQFQFITKAFKTKESILYNFDVDSSCVLYDGTDVLFTPLSAYAYATGCNYVNSNKRCIEGSVNYNRRLKKYFDKGFAVAFPELNLSISNDDIRFQNFRKRIAESDKIVKDNYKFTIVSLKELVVDNWELEKNVFTTYKKANGCEEKEVEQSAIIKENDPVPIMDFIFDTCTNIYNSVYTYVVSNIVVEGIDDVEGVQEVVLGMSTADMSTADMNKVD